MDVDAVLADANNFDLLRSKRFLRRLKKEQSKASAAAKQYRAMGNMAARNKSNIRAHRIGKLMELRRSKSARGVKWMANREGVESFR